MSNISQYWAEVKETRIDLIRDYPGGAVPLSRISDGAFCHASPDVAARALVDQSHRLASDAEAAAYQELQERRGRTLTATENLFGRQVKTIAVIGGTGA